MKTGMIRATFFAILTLAVGIVQSKTVLLKATEVQDGTDTTTYTFKYNPSGTLDTMYYTNVYTSSAHKYKYAGDTLPVEMTIEDILVDIQTVDEFFVYDSQNRITVDSMKMGGAANPPVNNTIQHYTYLKDTLIDTVYLYNMTGDTVNGSYEIVTLFAPNGDSLLTTMNAYTGATVTHYAYSDHNGIRLLDSAITDDDGGSLQSYYANTYDANGNITLTHTYIAPSVVPAENFYVTYEYGEITTPIANGHESCNGTESAFMSKSGLTINLPSGAKSGISGAIYSVSGQKILDLSSLRIPEGAKNFTIDRNRIGAPGAYILKAGIAGQNISRSFILR